MGVNTKPSLRSKRERIEAAIEEKNLTCVPGLPERLDAHVARVAEIDASPFERDHRARLRAEAEAALHADGERIVDQAIRASAKELDDAEGRLRAYAGTASEIDANVAARAALLAARVNAASAGAVVESVFDDAEFTGNIEVMRIVGMAALSRLRDLATGSTAKSTTSPEKVAHLAFAERFREFERKNPTPRQRVEAIGRERANRAVSIRESARFMTRLYGVGRSPAALPALRPEPPGHSSRMVAGPAFDLLNAGRIRR
jgi:hypothetical protein